MSSAKPRLVPVTRFPLKGWWQVFFGLVLLTACGSPVPPSPPRPTPTLPQPTVAQPLEATCGVCHMPVTEDCENRFSATGPGTSVRHWCSAICAAAGYVPQEGAGDWFQVLDYQKKKMVPAETAFYLIDSQLEVVGAMAPPVAAFQDRPAADDTRKQKKGKVLTWGALLENLKKRPEFNSHAGTGQASQAR
ncbi:MAG: nitrous oxide reductase accessory protein NosL [Blastocatellia bacterium]|nr:nitrous oxide reductase accessory protein NosL [Blastocatellia bacterium]